MLHHLQLERFVYFNTILYHLQRTETFGWDLNPEQSSNSNPYVFALFQPVLPVFAGQQKQLHWIVMSGQITFAW